jgi:signal transduction histidine kinase
LRVELTSPQVRNIPTTIRLRLTLYWSGIIAAILLIAGVSTFILFERQQWGALDSALLEEADTAATTLSRLTSGPAVDTIVRRLSEERDLGPRRRVRIVRGDRVIADFGDRTAKAPPVNPDIQAPEVRDGRGGIFRFAIVPFQFEGALALLEDGVDASAIRKSIARLRNSLLLLLPLILIAAVSGGYLIAGRALIPIIATTNELAQIEPRDLSRRLDPGKSVDEIARLTHAINALLDRVERASNAERRFAADAAHELRTPLAVLRTGIEVTLSRDRTTGEYADALCSAFAEVIALCTMADQLLTLARLDQEATIAHERVDLGALVREVVEAVEPLVQSKSLALTVDAGGEQLAEQRHQPPIKIITPVVIEGNPLHLKRLVINLIDNAIKFTPANGHIEISAAARDGLAILRVADTGPGIPPEDLPFIFDRFFRSKTRSESGTGLGLSLCHEIVRLHRGEITASNRACGGAEVVVILPLA